MAVGRNNFYYAINKKLTRRGRVNPLIQVLVVALYHSLIQSSQPMKCFFKISPILLLMFALACDEDVVRGSGPVVTRTLDLPALRGIDVAGSQQVVVTQGNVQEVTVEGQANLIDILSTRVDDGVWDVRFTEDVRGVDDFIVYVTMATLEQVSVSGSGEVSSDGDFEIDQLSVSVAGSGGVSIAGTVDEQTVQLSGSGSVSNLSLTSRQTTATLSGSGDVRVTATEVLNATLSGSGDIRYRGNPATVNRNVSGSGSVSEG